MATFGEASLEYLSSTGWPVRLLDLELFMRDCRVSEEMLSQGRGEKNKKTSSSRFFLFWRFFIGLSFLGLLEMIFVKFC